ncbi:transcription repressor OFP13-like [Ananas comosus]|uniref:Transcription repressor n=1 Tax=Ananas comosus TaxID=4615 RepID=A0A6P5GS66_ANACO|nr:transcription repressor OFP13-like [Ananas comosus]
MVNQHPKTNSFRAHAASAAASIYNTANSVYDNTAYSTASDDTESLLPGPTHEALVPVPVRVRSDRLFFEPGATTRSIVHARRNNHNNNDDDDNDDVDNSMEKREEEEEGEVNADSAGSPFEESVALTVESTDPYRDFRASMEEMVVAHAVSDWEGLEELLTWYLNANGQKTHAFIVGAFVDLLVSLVSASASASAISGSDLDSDSPLSTISFDHEVEKENNVVGCRE